MSQQHLVDLDRHERRGVLQVIVHDHPQHAAAFVAVEIHEMPPAH